MPYEESGITLDFPDERFFCFENCSGYTQYSGNYFKEMDAGWFDVANKTLYLIELKDFTLANIKDRANAETRVWDMVKKSIDSCAMLVSILINSTPANVIQPCLPIVFDKSYQIRLLHIVKSEQHQKADIQFLNDSFKIKFKAYKELFGVSSSMILTYEQAKRHYNFIK